MAAKVSKTHTFTTLRWITFALFNCQLTCKFALRIYNLSTTMDHGGIHAKSINADKDLHCGHHSNCAGLLQRSRAELSYSQHVQEVWQSLLLVANVHL